MGIRLKHMQICNLPVHGLGGLANIKTPIAVGSVIYKAAVRRTGLPAPEQYPAPGH